MEGTSARGRVYEGFARIGKALANPARLELLDLLAQGERGVEELADAAGMRTSNTSAQLKELARAGLVTSRRAGTRVYYSLADPQVAVLLEHAKQLAHAHLPEVRQAVHAWLGDTTDLEPVTRDELAARLAAEAETEAEVEAGLVVLDVRSDAEYAAGHLPGALGIPADQLADRLDELPAGTEIVAYCWGRYCLTVMDTVRLLRARGFAARPLDSGVAEWRADGRAVSTSVVAA
ncbi:ArsR/SmtB family transcription factor [Actinomadura hibisca]|uniref:ArsR/SmtB family transcription factor n=1 Tax=Actinomadura hibisca TaxID=68565 RepID=UPI00082E66B5|nr:metalloregulator ArsR/SmtB family transcription factor [Actinomadura hibisca]